MATKIGGGAAVYINGKQYPLKSDVKMMGATVTRTSQVGLDGFHGVTEIPTQAWIEFTLSDFPDVDISGLQDLVDATINVTLASGKQAILRNAAQVNAVELDQSNGQLGLRFEGPQLTWITTTA
jgi:Phage tail tube protein